MERKGAESRMDRKESVTVAQRIALGKSPGCAGMERQKRAQICGTL